MKEVLDRVRQASRVLSALTGEERSKILAVFSNLLIEESENLILANQKDLDANRELLEPVLLQRLKFDKEKLQSVIKGIRALSDFPDLIGRTLEKTLLDDNLVLEKITVPLGVVGVIFESRPDVLPQLASLALRSGNGLVLKGGAETFHSNQAMMRVIQRISEALPALPADWIALFHTRDAVRELLHFPQYIDLIIPRGSNELVRSIQAESEIPVLGHASGVCHLYVHQSADVEAALRIIVDAKTQYPSACNSVETILVDEAVAASFLPRLFNSLDQKGVNIRGDERVKKMFPQTELVPDTEWSTEYGDLTIAVKIVSNISAAIQHINQFGSHHTDGIIGSDKRAQDEFKKLVDSSSIMLNCSTRFADGYRYGFGAEVGISTGKIHARGPVGIEGLLSYKYILYGEGQVVSEYSGVDARAFRHEKLKN